MLRINNIKKAHFTGIGGIGMSALAQLFVHDGVIVSGSDISTCPTTEILEKKGIHVSIGHLAKNVPADVDVLVYSDAVPPDNPERAEAVRRGIPQYSYFQMLGKVSEEMRVVAVAGTHGKTTTTGMLGKILIDACVAPTVIVGSIVKDFGSNYVAGTSNLFVVEACEYYDHLLELSPEVLVVNNLEWDHTDYFPSLAALQETFKRVIAKVPSHGAIVTDPKNPNIAPLLTAAAAPVIDYTQEPVYQILLPGEFNQMNARAAAAAARAAAATISDDTISASLAHFQGTWRRFEYKGKTKNGAIVYDDYAHHPTAVRETIKALRAKTTGNIFIAFHPHLFSRTRDLLDQFATAFAGAHDVVIAPIYAAREKDDGTISHHMLADRIAATGVSARALESFDEIAEYLSEHTGAGDVIMTMGAGDIYHVADQLVN